MSAPGHHHHVPHRAPHRLPHWRAVALFMLVAYFGMTIYSLVSDLTLTVGVVDPMTTIVELVRQYRYVAVFLAALFSSLGVPVPAATIIMAAGFLASTGAIGLPGAILSAAVGTVLGDQVVYWTARHFGLRAARRLGLGRQLEADWFRGLEASVNRHAFITVFLGQFSAGFGPLINFLAGLAKMRYRRFLPFNIAGELSTACVSGLSGYAFGENWETLAELLGHFVLAAIIAAVIIYVILWRRVLRHVHRHLSRAAA